LGPVAVRAADLTSQALGRTASVRRPRHADLAVNPWLRRGVLVQVVHASVEGAGGNTAPAVVLTVAVGTSSAEVTFVVEPNDLITLYS
jgi:tartrate dehydratase alpha subunit/fumarate hydratase class I-like protein